jgi:Protein of unknown function (DUF1579)
MKRITLTICSATLLLLSCNNSADDKTATASADTTNKMADVKTETAAPPMDSAAMMKAWMDYATPGAMHTWMAKTNGTWEAEVSQWMDSKAPPTKVKATNVQTSSMGGRYVIGKFTSNMMGQPFEGMSTMGYDNAKKMFVSTWVDNMSTGITHMTGTYDEATKMMNLKGHQTDPATGKDSEIREEMKMIDDNTYTMTMYGPGMDGKEMKFMEGTFKKKK